jgi:predicted restriction endonuclease
MSIPKNLESKNFIIEILNQNEEILLQDIYKLSIIKFDITIKEQNEYNKKENTKKYQSRIRSAIAGLKIKQIIVSNSRNHYSLSALSDYEKELVEIGSKIEKTNDESKLLENEKDLQKRRYIIWKIARNQKIAKQVKHDAEYICCICKYIGFEKKNGGKYAEADHISPLSQSLNDSLKNLRCVCSNCHSILTYGSQSSIDILFEANNYLQN